MMVVLSTIVRRFEFSVTPNLKRPVPTFQTVIKPMDGIELIVQSRY